MADSQNTYQNDVKIKSGVSFSTIITALIAIFVIGFGGYYICDNEITKAYEKGYEFGYDEGYDEGYNKGKDKGYSSGKQDGYTKGYNDAKEKFEKTSVNTGNKSSGSSNKGNSYSESSSNEKEYSYILNKNTDKFHYSWCHSVNQMKEKNKIYFNGTRSEAINKGYSPCGNCHP